jgi:hypothetical protein
MRPIFSSALLALVVLAPAVAPTVAAAATAPQAFTAEYEVFQNDEKLGVGRITLRALGGGRIELVTHSEATEGLFAAAGVRRDETSVIDWNGAMPSTLEYRMQQKAAWNERSQQLVVNAAARTATSTWKDESANLVWVPGLIDKHGLTAVLMSELAAGRRGTMTFPVAGKKDVETQTYRIAGSVILETAIGRERAVRVERVRDDGDTRVTKIWFARERGWLPLRIKQYESDGETLDLRIVRVL